VGKLLVSVDCRSVLIGYNSTRGPEFYLREPVTFTCNAANFKKNGIVLKFFYQENRLHKARTFKFLSHGKDMF